MLQERYRRQRLQAIANKMIFHPLANKPTLKNWCPQDYTYSSIPAVVHTPSLPGRINHELYGNCYIHAEILVSREAGEIDETVYLVTLVDAVKVNGSYTTNKRVAWYEIPKQLVISAITVEFCKKVKCMVDSVEYNGDEPSQSTVNLVCQSVVGELSNRQMTVGDILASKDGDIQEAFENFKCDYKNWFQETNIEHAFNVPS